jgi:hypothetical protein
LRSRDGAPSHACSSCTYPSCMSPMKIHVAPGRYLRHGLTAAGTQADTLLYSWSRQQGSTECVVVYCMYIHTYIGTHLASVLPFGGKLPCKHGTPIGSIAYHIPSMTPWEILILLGYRESTVVLRIPILDCTPSVGRTRNMVPTLGSITRDDTLNWGI